MCGIVGFWDPQGSIADPSRHLENMKARLERRGPDAHGSFIEETVGLALGHRRLSILDLSDEGSQPMTSASGRYVIVYNGEVYNFLTLRAELEGKGCKFRGNSDTEVLLASIETWGLREAVTRWNGMFALGVWDRQDRVLHLVRDRLGIKPLYVGKVGPAWVFTSDPGALLPLPNFTAEVDPQAAALMLRFGYVPAPWAIYRGLRKLDPGCIVSITEPGSADLPDPQSYWSVGESCRTGREDPLPADHGAIIDGLCPLVTDAVQSRMIADVPLGAFLSGGVDSSTVVALMQRASERPVKTFTVGFQDPELDEAGHAREVARHLGTDHTELIVGEQELLDVIPKLPRMYREPFADASQIPTFLISRLTRQQVTVSLSGDGGDELFAGYNRYDVGQSLDRTNSLIPTWLGPAVRTVMKGIPVPTWDLLGPLVPGFRSRGREFPLSGDRIHKLAGMLGHADFASTYLALLSAWDQPEKLVKGAGPQPGLARLLDVAGPGRDLVTRMQAWDQACYLPDDILTKVDRASMAVSLEARVPLLDHRVVEYAWRIPATVLAEGDRAKWPLRGILDPLVPPDLIDRPKRGFSVPLADWLRGPLRDWAEDLLQERRLKDLGMLNPRPVRKAWDEFLTGRRNWQTQLWSVLMFQAWAEEMRTRRSRTEGNS